MKPFVAIGRVLDEVSDAVQHLHSVDDCAKTENLYSAFEAVPGPAGVPLKNRFVCAIQMPVSLTIGVQNAIESCRWSSIFYLPAVLRLLTRIGYKNILVNLDDALKVVRTYRSGDLHHERAQRAMYSSETLENGSGL